MSWDVDSLPEPACQSGYPLPQLIELFGAIGAAELGKWMYGQTMSICEGRKYNHSTKEYEESCDGVAHGVVVYPWDVRRWMRGLPVID